MLARPVLTVAIDLFSRMVVGLHIGFEEPGYRTVMLCLRSAILPKDALLARNDLNPEAWPCHGSIGNLVMDNGSEFHSADLDDAMAQLLIDAQRCRTRTPWEKGACERWFKRLNNEVVHTLPGTTHSNPKRKGEAIPEAEASLTIADLRGIVLRWLVTDYSTDIHEGIDEAPIERWRRGVGQHPVDLPCEVGDLDILLMPAQPRSLTRTGIRMHGLTYGGHQPHGRLQELLNEPTRPDLCVIKYDPADLGWAYMLDWTTGNYLPLRCNTFDYADGLSLREHEAAAERARRQRSDYKLISSAELDRNRVENRRRIEELSKLGKLKGRRATRLADVDEDQPSDPSTAHRRRRADRHTATRAAAPFELAAFDADTDVGITLDTMG